MKPLKPLSLFAGLIVAVIACDFETEPINEPDGEYSFAITGINQSLTYEFSSANGGRVAVTDDIRNLSIFIIDEDGNIAYENRYYPYYEDSEIPDSIFIPALGAGDYQIVAVTADFYPYYDYYDPAGDTLGFLTDLRVPSYVTSEGPIFVGFTAFTLTEDTEVVAVDMKNISAKVTFKLAKGQSNPDGGLSMEIETTDAKDYDVFNEEFTTASYDYNYVYGWLDSWSSERSVYVLPQTLENMKIYFYDYYSGTNFHQTIEFEELIPMEAGDAITFTLDMDVLLDGAADGVFNYEDIEWNDLGELVLP